ncbi:MAG: cell division topological specificity factor MinE [Solirubrobacterales bacterium]
MLNFLCWKKKEKTSSSRANERLRLVLTHDRIGTSGGLMEKLREEIIEVIKRHVEIDGDPEININAEGRKSVLDINIPLKGR